MPLILDDELEPVELPNGRLACGPHRLTVCGFCCVDFSYMDEELSEDDVSEEIDREHVRRFQQTWPEARAALAARCGLSSSPASARDAPQPRNHPLDGAARDSHDASSFRRGTGRVLPTAFIPPSAMSAPAELFPAGVGRRAIPPVDRFIRRGDPTQVLIYADGSCSDNGNRNPRAGWAFVFKPGAGGVVSARLEKKGPFGDAHVSTSNRAELRAVLGALRFRSWPGEGFTTLVLATDSEYVAKGATTWVRGWLRNGWKTSTGADVKNRDLWEMLLGEAERLGAEGVSIQFWRIPRGLNQVADRGAKGGAEEDDVDGYLELRGMLT